MVVEEGAKQAKRVIRRGLLIALIGAPAERLCSVASIRQFGGLMTTPITDANDWCKVLSRIICTR